MVSNGNTRSPTVLQHWGWCKRTSNRKLYNIWRSRSPGDIGWGTLDELTLYPYGATPLPLAGYPYTFLQIPPCAVLRIMCWAVARALPVWYNARHEKGKHRQHEAAQQVLRWLIIGGFVRGKEKEMWR